jgi:hypothetical protein
VRRILLSAATATLLAVLTTLSGPANPALASTGNQTAAASGWVDELPWPAVAPPGYVAPNGYMTVAPELCFFSYMGTRDFLTGGYTECLRQPGLHRAAALCADGTIVYGWTQEMDYGLHSSVECGNPWGDTTPEPAIAAWGEYYLDPV